MKAQTIINRIAAIFRENASYEAHIKSKDFLHALITDISFFHQVVSNSIISGEYFSNKHSTVIDFPVYSDERITMLFHCFMPLPDHSTNVSHQSIHHHGNLLLTTGAVWGSGYSSVIFDKGYKVDKDGTANMKLLSYYQNDQYSIEFVDSYQPHVVFYPKDISITLVLWSTDRFTAFDRFKKIGVSSTNKERIKRMIRFFGLSKMSNLNVVEGFDFMVANGKIKQIKDRRTIPFPRSRENYVQNTCAILQNTGMHDKTYFDYIRDHVSPDEWLLFEPWVSKILKDETVSDLFPKEFLNIEGVNIQKEELLEIYGMN